MKKIYCLLIVYFLFTVSISGKAVSWSAIGSEYSYFIGEQNIEDNLYNIQNNYGVYFEYSSFLNENPIGLHIRSMIQLPIERNIETGDCSDSAFGFNNHCGDTIVQGSMMIGAIYRNPIGTKNNVYFSIYPELRLFGSFISKEDFYILTYITIGSDIGFMRNLSENFFSQAGFNIGYNFHNNMGTKLIASPYMGFGLIY